MKKKIYLTLSYLFGMMLSTSAWAGGDPIAWQVTNPLPTTGFVNIPMKADYTFTNTSAKAISLKITQEVNDPQAFTIQDNCSHQPLLIPGQSCQVYVELKSETTGTKSVRLTMRYNFNVVPVPAIWQVDIQQKTNVGDITGKVEKALPDTTVKGHTYPIKFSFTNEGHQPATDIRIIKDPEDL